MENKNNKYVKLYNIFAGFLKIGTENTPVSFYIIEHEKGIILFDTGMPKECIGNLSEHWGEMIGSMSEVIMTENELVANVVNKLGISTSDVKYVIQSHLHLDHAGGIGLFPNATYIVQESEWAAAHDSNYPFPINQLYIHKDFDKPVNWLLLRGAEEDYYDLFGDGAIVIWFTPGHTPGHQSLVINTENHGHIVLTGDACNDYATLQCETKFSLCWNEEECIKSLQRFQTAKENGWLILVPHDSKNWDKFKKYYD